MENVKEGLNQAQKINDMIILTPRTDIIENQNEIVIYAEMPGVDEKAVNVSFENNVIALSGEMSIIEPSGDYKEIREEIVKGGYERSFSILSDISVDKISAKIKDGLLKVIMPKSEKVKPRKIEVRVE